ncbi:MAG: YraN family protein [Elusimicrobiota bacterium]
MTMRRALLGKWGEDRAARWLEERGWTVLERRWRCRLGELDIVAVDGDELVFVEVKTRSSLRCGAPEEAVGRAKRARIVRAACAYMRFKGIGDRALRFDVVALSPEGLRHIPAAF